MKKHYEIQAYDKQDGMTLIGIVLLNVKSAVDEKDALKKAKKLIKRPHYRVSRVWECDENHETNNKLKEELLKFMKSK